VNDLYQFLGGRSPRVACGRCRVNHVLPNVILDNLCHKALQGAATGSRLLKDAGTILVSFHSAFDGLNLPAKTAEPIQQFHLLFADVAHFLHLFA